MDNSMFFKQTKMRIIVVGVSHASAVYKYLGLPVNVTSLVCEVHGNQSRSSSLGNDVSRSQPGSRRDQTKATASLASKSL